MLNEGDDLNIIFFDSECVSCNKFAMFLNGLDKNNRLHFSGIGSNTFISMKEKYNFKEIDSIIYLNSKLHVFYYTDAIVEMLIKSNKFFYFLKLQYLIPFKIRKKIYHFFAKRRKKVQICNINTLDKEFQTKVLN